MKYITIKNAVMVFCYLLYADGEEITKSELEKLNEIGLELDKAHFSDYKNEMLEACQKQLRSVIDEEDFYDVIAEGVDKVLFAPVADGDKAVASRFLVWNLLTLAYSDKTYHHNERRLIKHIVRVCNIPTDIFLEMEHLMCSAIEVAHEHDLLSQSDRSYREIAPIIEEVEQRIEKLAEAAKNLIEDEVNEPSVEELKLNPTLSEKISEASEHIAAEIKDTVTPISKKAGAAVTGFFGSMGKRFGENKKEAAKKEEAANKEKDFTEE